MLENTTIKDMLDSLPVQYRADKWVIDLLSAIWYVDHAQRVDAEDTAGQVLLNRMTWILPVEEREAAITAPLGSPVNDRRAALSAKWQSGTDKCDIALIRRICAAWGLSSEVYYDGKHVVAVFLNSCTLSDIYALYSVLRNTIPAHLLFALDVSTPEETTAVYTGGTQIGCSSQVMLPMLKPERNFKTTVWLGGVETGSYSSHGLEVCV